MAITIADTGCGIAPEDLQRVFEPFFTTKANGNGLGLSICRSILWEIGGTMSLHSEPRKGTRVQVTVPWASSKLAGAILARRRHFRRQCNETSRAHPGGR